MSKILFLLSISILCYFNGFSQSPISLNYQSIEDLDVIMIENLMDINSVNAELAGELTNKKAVLTEYIVNGMEVSSSVLQIHTPIKSDTIIIKAKASRISEENLKLYIVIEDTYYDLRTISMVNDQQILMETELVTELAHDIPVFAYTTGVKKTVKFRGELHEAIDYCGLRDSKIHPSQWFEKFGITNYIYYTIDFK